MARLHGARRHADEIAVRRAHPPPAPAAILSQPMHQAEGAAHVERALHRADFAFGPPGDGLVRGEQRAAVPAERQQRAQRPFVAKRQIARPTLSGQALAPACSEIGGRRGGPCHWFPLGNRFALRFATGRLDCASAVAGSFGDLAASDVVISGLIVLADVGRPERKWRRGRIPRRRCLKPGTAAISNPKSYKHKLLRLDSLPFFRQIGRKLRKFDNWRRPDRTGMEHAHRANRHGAKNFTCAPLISRNRK